MPIVCAAERFLRKADFLVLPADKNGCRVMVDIGDLVSAHAELLGEGTYEQLSGVTLD